MSFKLCQIIGARPQFIKYFPVSKAIEKYNQENGNQIQDVLIHTGQHYDYQMSKVFFDELGIRKPDYHLEVGSGSHGEQTADILIKTEQILQKEKPDLVIVYGDTNSTLGGALAAAKLKIPIAHVEAGLRSFNRDMPEEINRICTDRISSLLFCPCQKAVELLKNEGFCINNNHGSDIDLKEQTVFFSGDVMYDMFLHAWQIAKSKSSILNSLNIKHNQYALLTLHRAENTDDPNQFQKIMQFVRKLADETFIVFPVHPRVKKLFASELNVLHTNILQINPVGYFDLLQLLDGCEFVLTDSGGLQKEAFWAKRLCVTLRDETEWVETVENGWNCLWQNFQGFDVYEKNDDSSYGNGNAAERIVEVLI